MKETDNNPKAFLACHGSVSRIWRLKGFTGGASLLYSSTSTVTLTPMLTPQVLANCPKCQEGRFVEFVWNSSCITPVLWDTLTTDIKHFYFSAHRLLTISTNRKLELLCKILGPLLFNTGWTYSMSADLAYANRKVWLPPAKKKISFPLGQWPGHYCF